MTRFKAFLYGFVDLTDGGSNLKGSVAIDDMPANTKEWKGKEVWIELVDEESNGDMRIESKYLRIILKAIKSVIDGLNLLYTQIESMLKEDTDGTNN